MERFNNKNRNRQKYWDNSGRGNNRQATNTVKMRSTEQ